MENSSPPPQWAPDPMGRYAQRFWDGDAWTDFVATAEGGEPTTDPLVPQGAVPEQWAPDPTGGYAQRYWDGDAWTDFVASAAGGDPARDPLEPGVRWPPPAAPVAAVAVVATADPEPQPEWIDTRPPGRRRLRLATWLALGLAVAVGVTFALTRGSGDAEPPTAASTHDGAAAAPTSTTGPAAATTTTGPAGTPSTTRPAGSGATGKKSAPVTTRPTTPPTATKPAAAAAPHSVNSAQDQAVADGVALTVADLPQGFRADSAAPSRALDSSFPPCKAFHARLAGTNAVATAKSPDYSDGAQRVASSVHLLVTPSQAASVVDMVHDPALPRCLDRVFGDAVRSSIARSGAAPIDLLKVQVGRLTVAPVGDQSAAVRVVTTVTSRGATIPMSADLVAFRVGRAAVITVFQSPQSGGARDAVLAAISARLRHAGADAR